ncbi:MAG: 1-deoxy-D-xylulose-5-phosphate synthase [archaeon]
MLEKIDSPDDLKKLQFSDLPGLAGEIRQFLLENVSRTGGHLASSLGVVELTIALHYCLNSPADKIVWDVGHQSYPHKILTGRRDRFHTLRQAGGISGFPKISECAHDAFGVGHASTSISAALGMAKARDLAGKSNHVIAVIGDGALTGGMALEAINQAGYLNSRIIIILNDNRMSIDANVGALSEYTHRISRTRIYQDVKADISRVLELTSGHAKELAERLRVHLKGVGSPGLVFEKLGIDYIGPVDGHDIEKIILAINEAKEKTGPVLIHAITKKGKGYGHAENNATKFHGLGAFNVENGECTGKSGNKSYTETFAETLVKLGEKNRKIVGITAAMPQGTGMIKFAERFPERFFDVGIAEQHAVTFAAGLAASGLRPVVAIYSTFLQRAYDQIIHDVCLQNLPVVFALDRAGIVGDDGPTHHGALDLSYLRSIPNLVIMAPKDENEFQHMLKTSVEHDGPIAIRYPRGCGLGVEMDSELKPVEIGKCEILSEGKDIVLVAIGSMVYESLEAARILKKHGVSATVINARFAKPIDRRILEKIRETKKAVAIEENSILGGFGSSLSEHLGCDRIKLARIGLPDRFIEHGSQSYLRIKYGLTKENIAKVALSL